MTDIVKQKCQWAYIGISLYDKKNTTRYVKAGILNACTAIDSEDPHKIHFCYHKNANDFMHKQLSWN